MRRRALFSVPVDLAETADFQRRVLEASRDIPFGEARPYAWVAERIGHPHAVRAVGTALGRNPVPLVIRCHRCRAAGGKLGGFSASGGTTTKAKLLALEGVRLDGARRDAGEPRLPGL